MLPKPNMQSQLQKKNGKIFQPKRSHRNKKAKPALCFARIAKAFLGDGTLHNSSFLLIKKRLYNPAH